MFGYVKAYKPELRIKEFELYKAVYCSLCRDLGKKYGLISRFSLSYDFTFLAILQLSLVDGCAKIHRKRCVCNPFKKCNYLCGGEMGDLPSAAAEIMLYCKLEDNISDEGFLKSNIYKILKFLTKKGYFRAVAQFPEIKDIFDEYIKSQSEIEKANVQNIDIAADPTAKMLSSIFALCSSNGEDRALKRLGYCMGRWIYILDAAADLELDIKKGRYNPLTEQAKNKENITAFLKEHIEGSLNMCISEAKTAFELIDIMRFKNILGNIVYLGLEESQNHVLNKENK